MFFSEKITKIKSSYRVLEVGPGSLPHPRSDVFLEREFFDEEEIAQRGFSPKIKLKKPIVYYKGGKFPFKDNEFDYVICSHVLEHVSLKELPLFIAELQRVAKMGYIEFPNIFYELINYQPVHLWLMNYRDNVIFFLDKSKFNSNLIHKIYREMFYGNDQYLNQVFVRHENFFFCGFEWQDKINYEIINDFNQLVTEEDYLKYKKFFNDNMKNKYKISVKDFIKKIIKEKNFNKLKNIKNKIKDYLFMSKSHIKNTAIIENQNLVKISKGVEIGEYVIIKAFENNVEIGECSQINPFTVIYGGSGVYIGKNVMIAPHCVIAAGNHDYKQIEKPIRFAGNLSKGPIIIEDNVWIGANCTITDGVKISHDAVVAANSLVNKDVGPYEIHGGVPAKFISNRLNNK